MGELVTEKLDLRGPTKSKSLARQVSLWHRSILNDRLDFKASAKGFSRQEVNPAYSSQLCPICGYLDRRNRVGDAFQCLNCGHAAPSDQTASVNLKARAADPAIQVWTPHPTVKQILLKRYQARLESRTPSLRNETLTTVTVTGQTSDTELTTPVQRRRRANARLEGNDAVPVRPSKNETAVDNKAKPAAQECNDYVQLRFW